MKVLTEMRLKPFNEIRHMIKDFTIISTYLVISNLCFGTPVDQSQLIFEKEKGDTKWIQVT